VIEVSEFDPSASLEDDEVIAEYLIAALEDDNPDVFFSAVRRVDKAKSYKVDKTDNPDYAPRMVKKPRAELAELKQRIASALSIVESFSLDELELLVRRRDMAQRMLARLLSDNSGRIALDLVESGTPAERLVGEPLPSGMNAEEVAEAIAAYTLDESVFDAAGLHKDPNMLNGETFGAALGVSRQTVNEWRQQGRVIGLKSNRKGFRYPLIQLDAHKRPLRELPLVVLAFGNSHWAAWSWLTAPHAGFDGNTPLDALKSGEEDKVLAAAEGAGGDFA